MTAKEYIEAKIAEASVEYDWDQIDGMTKMATDFELLTVGDIRELEQAAADRRQSLYTWEEREMARVAARKWQDKVRTLGPEDAAAFCGQMAAMIGPLNLKGQG